MFYSKERNKVLLSTLFLSCALTIIVSDNSYDILLVIAISCVTFALFSSMTIELKGNELSIYFGFGFWRKNINVLDIKETSIYQSKWYQGIGIRKLKDGWLYNASVGSALKLSLCNGKHIYIGCKHTERLNKALIVGK